MAQVEFSGCSVLVEMAVVAVASRLSSIRNNNNGSGGSNSSSDRNRARGSYSDNGSNGDSRSDSSSNDSVMAPSVQSYLFIFLKVSG